MSARSGKLVITKWLATLLMFIAVTSATAVGPAYRQTVAGVAIYFGIVPAGLVRGHPPEHPEGKMHGGVPAGENHIMVALFDDKTGKRIVRADVTASITELQAEKKLEPMVIAGAATYGNYFNMPGPGPYRIDIYIHLPGDAREIRASFTWRRS